MKAPRATDVLRPLIGKTIQTATGKQNRIISIDQRSVIVGTEKTPIGSPVPIAWIQDALDELFLHGVVEVRKPHTWERRSAFVAAVLLTLPGVAHEERPLRILMRERDSRYSPIMNTGLAEAIPSRSMSPSPQALGQPLTPEIACAAIHELLRPFPRFKQPSDFASHATFRDGLYFFFEKREVSIHAPSGRLVRVGNHPYAAGGLVNRLKNHYRTSRGAKNGSVFRRYLGGALIRRDGPDSTCLMPAPGKGHWEIQKGVQCEDCLPYEQSVTNELLERFEFTCVEIADQSLRNQLESLIVASLAACGVCSPTESWLGTYSYGAAVKASGLWNSQGVGEAQLTAPMLQRLERLVGETRWET